MYLAGELPAEDRAEVERHARERRRARRSSTSCARASGGVNDAIADADAAPAPRAARERPASRASGRTAAAEHGRAGRGAAPARASAAVCRSRGGHTVAGGVGRRRPRSCRSQSGRIRSDHRSAPRRPDRPNRWRRASPTEAAECDSIRDRITRPRGSTRRDKLLADAEAELYVDVAALAGRRAGMLTHACPDEQRRRTRRPHRPARRRGHRRDFTCHPLVRDPERRPGGAAGR